MHIDEVISGEYDIYCIPELVFNSFPDFQPDSGIRIRENDPCHLLWWIEESRPEKFWLHGPVLPVLDFRPVGAFHVDFIIPERSDLEPLFLCP